MTPFATADEYLNCLAHEQGRPRAELDAKLAAEGSAPVPCVYGEECDWPGCRGWMILSPEARATYKELAQ